MRSTANAQACQFCPLCDNVSSNNQGWGYTFCEVVCPEQGPCYCASNGQLCGITDGGGGTGGGGGGGTGGGDGSDDCWDPDEWFCNGGNPELPGQHSLAPAPPNSQLFLAVLFETSSPMARGFAMRGTVGQGAVVSNSAPLGIKSALDEAVAVSGMPGSELRFAGARIIRSARAFHTEDRDSKGLGYWLGARPTVDGVRVSLGSLDSESRRHSENALLTRGQSLVVPVTIAAKECFVVAQSEMLSSSDEDLARLQQNRDVVRAGLESYAGGRASDSPVATSRTVPTSDPLRLSTWGAIKLIYR